MTLRHVAPAPRHLMYLFNDAYVFCGRTLQSETARFSAALLLSLDGRPFELGAMGAHARVDAAIARPMLLRTLRTDDVPLVSIGLSPNHRDFRSFADLPDPGFLPIDRDWVGPHATVLETLHRGDCDGLQARRITDAVVDAVVRRLPPPRPLDPRVQQAIDRLEADPMASLDALAEQVGLSYDRMSHLFSESMGLPMRSYALSLKIHNASRLSGSDRSLTDIAHTAGFADSSHFSRVWTKAFGAPPSYFFNPALLRVVTEFSAREPDAAGIAG